MNWCGELLEKGVSLSLSSFMLECSPSPAAIYHHLAALHRLEGDVSALVIARGILFTASESDSGWVRLWAALGCLNHGHLDVSCGQVG